MGATLDPVPGEPAAVARTDGRDLLVVADVHAGIERELRGRGVEIHGGARERRTRLCALVERTDPDRLVVVGDLGHEIGGSGGSEREELIDLFDALTVPVTVVKGNHDGDVEDLVPDLGASVTVTPTTGTTIGDLGFAHGHTWPGEAVLGSDVVAVGHEHPVVRLEDAVGGSHVERVWLRGDLAPRPFAEQYGWGPDEGPTVDGELVVVPAFNERSSGTWVNVAGQDFLSPFLPEGLDGGEAYLLDGTRLGPYDLV